MLVVAPRYLIGETVRATLEFVDSAGLAVAATGIAVTAKKPDGSSASFSVLTDAGTYCDIPATAVGRWSVRVTCTGPTASATETQFEVLASAVI